MSEKSSKKVAKAENVKRTKTEPKPATVNGKAKFENGKLVTQKKKELAKKVLDDEEGLVDAMNQIVAEPEPAPKTLAEAVELIEALRAEITKLKTHRTAPKLEELPDIESPIKYLNFCQVQKYRDELLYILAEVEKIEGIEIRHNAYAESYRYNNTLVGELFPLKRQWSARVNPGVVKRWDSPEEYLDELKAQVEKVPAVKVEQKKPAPVKAGKPSIGGDEAVVILKDKIEGLSVSSKGFEVPSAVKLTDPKVKEYIKDNGFTATGNIIKLNRF